jgi:hypothetical protein
MNHFFDLRRATLSLTAGMAVAALVPLAQSAGPNDAVAISAKVSPDYVRQLAGDGTPVPETFAFAKGGLWKSSEAGTHDDLEFLEVARAVTGPLAGQKYVSTRDPRSTRLLIMVYWGTTRAPEHPTNSIASENLQVATQMNMAANLDSHMVHFNPGDSCAPTEMQQGSQVNSAIRSPDQIDTDNAMSGAMAMELAEDGQRMQLNRENAMMLGYDSWWAETARYKGTPQEYRQQDLLAEIEARRYFVVLMAYDFQMLWKDKKPKLLWETRFSIREGDDNFSRRLAGMVGSAAPYFGRDSGKLVHAPLPEGRVDVGPLKNLAFIDSK